MKPILNEQLTKIRSMMAFITEGNFSIGDEDWMNKSSENRSEELFGKNSNLEKQFSELMVSHLTSNDENEASQWATFQAVNIYLKRLGEDKLIKEIEYRVTNDENPTTVYLDVLTRSPRTIELLRLRKKIKESLSLQE